MLIFELHAGIFPYQGLDLRTPCTAQGYSTGRLLKTENTMMKNNNEADPFNLTRSELVINLVPCCYYRVYQC